MLPIQNITLNMFLYNISKLQKSVAKQIYITFQFKIFFNGFKLDQNRIFFIKIQICYIATLNYILPMQIRKGSAKQKR